MERVLLTGFAMVGVGIALAVVYLVLTSYGTAFEMFEDNVARWLGKV